MEVVTESMARDSMATRYTSAAMFGLYIFEYLLTLGDEVRLVWQSRLSIVKTLFFVNRYIPFSFTLLSMYTYIINSDEPACRGLFIALSMLSATGVIFAETTLALRVYVIWERSRRILICLAVLILAGIIGGYYGTAHYVKAASISQFAEFPDGCVVRTKNRLSEAISYALILVFETFVLVLMMIRVTRYRVVSSPLMRVAYGDSVLYCLAIALTTTANLILLGVGSEILARLLLLPQATLHNILCSRLLLRLRSTNTSLSEDGFLSVRVDSIILLDDIRSKHSTPRTP